MTKADLVDIVAKKVNLTNKAAKEAVQAVFNSIADTLKKGDKVVTKSGMHGKIVDLNDKDSSCVIETLAGKIKFERSAISMEMSQKVNTST